MLGASVDILIYEFMPRKLLLVWKYNVVNAGYEVFPWTATFGVLGKAGRMKRKTITSWWCGDQYTYNKYMFEITTI